VIGVGLPGRDNASGISDGAAVEVEPARMPSTGDGRRDITERATPLAPRRLRL